MKNFLIPTVLLAMLVSSCSTSQYAVKDGNYESDEVYYQPGEKFISDYALVDDEAESQSAAGDSEATRSEDDYYSGDNTTSTTNNGGVVNNYYGNVYNAPGQMFGGRFYGSTFLWPSYYSTWNPYTGWNFGINYGMHWGWGSYWNDPWGWNNPWYDPWGYNNWCWNSWRNPYGFYNPYFGWGYGYGYGYGNYWYNGYGSPGFGWNNGWNNGWDGPNNNGFITGNRPALSVGSAINSSYDESVVYSARNKKPLVNSDQINKDPNAVVNTTGRDKQNAGKDQPAVNPVDGPVVSTEEGRAKTPQTNVVAADLNKPVLSQNTTASNGTTTGKVPAGKPNLASVPQVSVGNSGNIGDRTNTTITNSGDRQMRPSNITKQPAFNVEQNRPSRTNVNTGNQTVRPITPDNRGNQTPPRVNEPSRRPSEGVRAPSVQPTPQPERRQPSFTPSQNDNSRRDNSFSVPSSPDTGRSGGGSIGGGSVGGGSNSRGSSGGGGGSSSGARRK